MPAYHYQCANCYCTLYMDDKPADGTYFSVVNGELCYSCKRQKIAQEDEEDDD